MSQSNLRITAALERIVEINHLTEGVDMDGIGETVVGRRVRITIKSKTKETNCPGAKWEVVTIHSIFYFSFIFLFFRVELELFTATSQEDDGGQLWELLLVSRQGVEEVMCLGPQG